MRSELRHPRARGKPCKGRRAKRGRFGGNGAAAFERNARNAGLWLGKLNRIIGS